MSRQVKSAAIQFNINLGSIEPNLEYVRKELETAAAAGVKLAVLPEMWATGFAYSKLAELSSRTGSVLAKLAEISLQHGMVIVGSLPEPHESKVYNTAYVIDCGEIIGKYRKIHLFSLMQEDRYFDAGNSWLLADTTVGKLGVLICYDLRFPELARRLAVEGADIFVVPGEWPKPRQEHWRALLLARAIENQAFVIAANSCGITGKLDFFGMSMIIDPKGELLAEGGYEAETLIATLDFGRMDSWRNQIPCFNDRKPECY